jgi:CRP-like cAMP-binding protein
MPTPAQLAPLRNYYKQLLPTMTDESWNLCEQVVTIRTFKKGEMILREGMVCNTVSFINYGSVRMYYVVDGKEKIFSFCNELNYISDYRSFLTREPARAYLQALEATEVVDTSYEGLQMLYENVPEANKLGRLIAEGLFIEMSDGADTEKNETIDARYRKIVNEQPWLMQRVPQYMIASYLGITPEALSRVKARMSRPKKAEIIGI